MYPDLLAIGHVARDDTPEGFRVGGAVTYGALTAVGMGLAPAVVTSVGPELDLQSAMPDVQVRVVPSANTTAFRNTYHDGIRSQAIKDVAAPITAADVPLQWRSTPLVLLGPMAREVSYEIARCFPDSVVMASIQGWLRQWDGEGRVSPAHWDGGQVLPYVSAAILSADDVEGPGLVERWKEMAPVLILTDGSRGRQPAL